MDLDLSKTLVPYERSVMSSTLTPDEVRQKISESIETGVPWWMAYVTFTRWERYFGGETATGFWIVRALPWGNSYRPYLWINLQPCNTGTLVSLVFFGYGVFITPIMIIIGLLVFGLVLRDWWKVLFFIVGVFCIHALCYAFYVIERKQLSDWLKALLTT